jgi:hypothetical protein
MSLPAAGWFPNPEDPTHVRWWDGSKWSQMTVPLSEAGVPVAVSSASVATAAATPGTSTAVPAVTNGARAAWHPTKLFWIVGAVVLLFALIGLSSGFGGFLVIIGLACLITGIFAAAAKRLTWLNIPASPGIRGLVIGASAILLIIGAGISPHSPPAANSSDTGSSSTIRPLAQTAPTRTPSATPTPTPTPTPVVSFADYSTAQASTAQQALIGQGIAVALQTTDGQSSPSDWTGWTIARQSPAVGTPLYAGQTVTLFLSPPPPPAPVVAPAPAAPAPAAPAGNGGATAMCRDGSLSYSAHRQGTCSHHGGVAVWY